MSRAMRAALTAASGCVTQTTDLLASSAAVARYGKKHRPSRLQQFWATAAGPSRVRRGDTWVTNAVYALVHEILEAIADAD
jgi:hypothetical protein